MSNNTGYAFVLCCSRTGSTLLRFVLDSHPSIWCPPELHIGSLCHTLRRILAVVNGEETVGGIAGGERPIDPATAVGVRDCVERIIRLSPYWKEEGIFCDKSITTIDHVQLVRMLFPEARFLCLYRHCMDVVHSGIERCRFGWRGFGFLPYIRNNPANIVDALVDYWIDNTTKILDAEGSAGELCFRIKYEALLCDTKETIEDLFQFLGLDWGDRPLSSVFSSHHQPGPGDTKVWSTTKFDRSRIGNGRALDRLVSARQLGRMNELLSILGYQVVEPDYQVYLAQYGD